MKISSKIFIVFALLANASPLFGQTIPIVEISVGGIIGGAENGRWVKDKQVAPKLSGKDEYTLIDLKTSGATAKTFGGKPEVGAPCEDFYYVELESKPAAGIALGAAAKWNPLPRPVTEISADDPTYKKIARDFLALNGLPKAPVHIKQAYRADFDGDGTDEVVLAATYFKSGTLSPSAAAGDYSFVLLRKIVGGKARNISLGGDFIKKAIEFGAPSEYGISAIADLNGDGKMELVVWGRYYEGGGSTVYEMKGAKPIEVLSTACGV